jgi:hypothetical protein
MPGPTNDGLGHTAPLAAVGVRAPHPRLLLALPPLLPCSRGIENKHSTDIRRAHMTYLRSECSYRRAKYTEQKEEIQRRWSACFQETPRLAGAIAIGRPFSIPPLSHAPSSSPSLPSSPSSPPSPPPFFFFTRGGCFPIGAGFAVDSASTAAIPPAPRRELGMGAASGRNDRSGSSLQSHCERRLERRSEHDSPSGELLIQTRRHSF